MNAKKAIQAIERHGVCLVFPIDNSKELPSLWYDFFPRSKMRWEWDSDGDNRVAELWHLREVLSRSGKVVYAKWLKGRATFFSHQVFTALHHHLALAEDGAPDLSRESREMLAILDDNSPLSTKQLKRAVELEGKYLESTYQKAIKALWDRLLIVGYGEIDDGAFPSLAMGSTRNLFEPLWRHSVEGQTEAFLPVLDKLFAEQPIVAKQVDRLCRRWRK